MFAKITPLYIWSLLACILVFAALNRHSRTKPYSYSSQVMSDKAGYFVYLPALFIYQFKAQNFPQKVDSLTGNGFFLNLANNKVHSKYPVGTAVLLSPFFLTAHLYVSLSGGLNDGFSMPYQNAIDLAAVCYLLLGLFFLNRFLLNYFSQKIIAISLSTLFLGSNLYYYAIFEGAYSHVYSFFLFSTWLFCLKEFEKTQEKKYWLNLFALATMVILVRQMNLVYILISLFMVKEPMNLMKGKSLQNWAMGLGISALLLLPQIAYNIYLTGTPFFYSYQNEGFIYWFSPKIKEVIWAFENGWLTTNPSLILSVIGLPFLLKKHKKEGLSIAIIAASCTYLYASWWCYNLGCAYGHRGFVDIYPFLALPFSYFINQVLVQKKKLYHGFLYLFLLAAIVFNLKYIYTYDSCWPENLAQSDFEIFWHFLTSSTK